METPEATRNDDDDELSEDEFPFDLTDDEAPVGLDDEEAEDLDIGVSIQSTDDGEGEPDTEMDWDLAEFLAPPPRDGPDADDQAGPEGFDPAIGVEEQAPENLDDASLGFEAGETFIAPAMPDWGPEGPERALFDDRELELPDETEIADAPASWGLCFERRGRFEALHAAHGFLFAGGETLIVVHGGSIRQAPTPSAVLQLQSVMTAAPHAAPTLFATTKSGGLLRFVPPSYDDAHWLEQPAGSRRVLHPPTIAAWPDTPNSGDGRELVALTTTGQLLAPLRGMSVLSSPGMQARPTKLPLFADRALALAESGAGLSIVERTESGTWCAHPVPARIAQSLAVGPFDLVACGRFVVLAGTRLGVVAVDLIQGTFQRVPGCVGVTALAAQPGEEPHFWVSLGHEISGRSEFVRVDPINQTATRVAAYPTVFDDEFTPVRALAWSPEANTLFAAGDFGVVGFRPPTT